MQKQATSRARAFAQVLRREMTDSERALWRRLSGEQLGVKFRRQHPLGSYVADFACLAPRLIVELDGSQHSGQAAYDQRRDAFFRAQGFDVMRFASDAPFIQLDGVLQAVHNRLVELRGEPPSQPSPRGGRSQTTQEQSQ